MTFPVNYWKWDQHLLLVQYVIRERLHKKTHATAGKQLWEYFLCHFKSVVFQLEAFSNHGDKDLRPNRGTRVTQARVTPLCHFCVSGIIIFFQYQIEFFFAIT